MWNSLYSPFVSTAATAPCLLCMTPAHRLHSHYERTLADLPWTIIACICGYGCVSGFVRTPTAGAAFSPNLCPPWRPPGPIGQVARD